MGNDATRRLTSCLMAAALAATTGLLAPSAARAQDNCDVVLQLEEPGPLESFALAVGYPAAAGDFVGDSTIPNFGPAWGTEQLACTTLISVQELTAIDDNVGLLSMFLGASTDPFAGPVQIVSCIFALDSGFPCPTPGDFSIVQENFPDDPFIPPFQLPPPPAASIASVTARIPVCGDGFIEGTEECDDSNAADGDCCSSTCTLDPVGTPCPDASVCTLNETCNDVGRCVVGERVRCDDGLFCTFDRCDAMNGCVSDPIPSSASACRNHGSPAKINLRDDTSNDARDRLRLEVTLQRGLIGDPSATTEYAVCVFDTVGGNGVLVDQIQIPTGLPWVARRASSPHFSYKDPTGSAEGIYKIRLKADRKGNKAVLRLRARGVNMTLPGPFSGEQYLAQDPDVIVQIENSEGGCWQIELDGQGGSVGPDRFQGKDR